MDDPLLEESYDSSGEADCSALVISMSPSSLAIFETTAMARGEDLEKGLGLEKWAGVETGVVVEGERVRCDGGRDGEV